MALYAYDSEDVVAAIDAESNGRYWCLECRLPVKMRSGKNRIPHFYHLQLSPSCRLHSKSEDHLLLQLQIQDLLPRGESKIEHPFSEIKRVSDLVWETKKITFEIQCSPIYPKEVDRRIKEYKSLGYTVIWILDDRSFNKRILRPAEPLLRQNGAFYASFQRHLSTQFYDQFEILSKNRRIKKSRKYPINFRHPHPFPPIELPLEWPLQIIDRAEHSPIYFPGDLLDRAIRSSIDPSLAISMQYWADLERDAIKNEPARKIIEKVKKPFLERLNAMLAERG